MTRDTNGWCRALADTLLPEAVNAGAPVRLDCDDSAVEHAAAVLGISRGQAVPALVKSLRDEALVSQGTGVSALARARQGQPPSYLAGLALLVLAASRMASDEIGSMAAYYLRVADLLEIAPRANWPQVPGVPELVQRFEDLARWLSDHEQGRRGLLDLPSEVHPAVVGMPVSQSLLRAGDRATLGVFFERTERLIAAGWDPVHQLRRWSGRHQLSTPLQELLGEHHMHAALAGALRAALRSWDGTSIDSEGRKLLRSALALHLPPLPFTLSVTVPGLDSPVTGLGPDGSRIALDSQTPAAVPLSWLSFAREQPVIIDTGAERVRLLTGPTILFEITPLGVQQAPAAVEDPVWALTCDRALIAECAENQRLGASLPSGWVLLCDVEPELLGSELRSQADDGHRALHGVEAVGGLRLGEGVWLLDHPPTITVEAPEPAPVTLDGRSFGDIETHRPLILRSIAPQSGVHTVEIGDVEMTVEIAARGPRTGIGSLAVSLDPHHVHAGACATREDGSERVTGPLLQPPPDLERPLALIVRYRCPVDVIDADGSVRKLRPPIPAAWLDHVGLPQDGPWEIPNAHTVVWVCGDSPGRKFVIAHQPLDVPLSDDVLDVADWYEDTEQLVDRSDGNAHVRWRRILEAAAAEQ